MPDLPTFQRSHRCFLGIDPGKSGGLVALTSSSVRCLAMPETELDVWSWFDEMRDDYGPTAVACIEWINPGIFGINKSDMAKLYGSFMSLRMALTAAGISFYEVKPKEWQAVLGILPRKQGTKTKKRVRTASGIWTNKIVRTGGESTSQWKGRLRAKAQQLFPALPLWRKTKGEQLAVCDALLVAEFCRLTYK